MTKIRHVLGISGGKDSAALAIYLKNKHPELDLEYYCCDTGKELDETYKLIENLEVYLGKPIKRLQAAEDSPEENPFDHFVKMYTGYLPSATTRWCTQRLKLEPFERYVGNDLVVSYVGIRGDEDREGYISKKSNIQSIFPFRQNIWSEDVVQKLLNNNHIAQLLSYYNNTLAPEALNNLLPYLQTPISPNFTLQQKAAALLDYNTKAFNQVVFSYLQTTNYPLSKVASFPLLDNDDILIRDDIFNLLRESGVGVPAYYEKIAYQIDGQTAYYARSRSGCFFCFFQQRIEWVWLYEQHPDLFKKAMEYEKEGYSWMHNETLEQLIQPERIEAIKRENWAKTQRNNKKSLFLTDILDDAEEEGCAACFI